MGRSGRRTQQFKQFQVSDDACGMKVGTDALILGSWAGEWTVGQGRSPKRILDVGTGSGILALMVAQRFPDAIVDAIELEPDAVAQATENAAMSPFGDRIHVHHCALQGWQAESPYDLVVVNPPFFHDHPKGTDPKRNLARHDDSLPLAGLLKHSHRLLAPRGELAVVYPEDRAGEFAAAASLLGLHEASRIRLQSSPDHGVIRSLWALTNEDGTGSKSQQWLIEREPLLWGKQAGDRLKPFVLEGVP